VSTKGNEEILEELTVEPADVEAKRRKSNCLQHARRLNNNRMPKIMLNYRPNGRTQLGRYLKILLDRPKRVY
jgi:hypothetical protein